MCEAIRQIRLYLYVVAFIFLLLNKYLYFSTEALTVIHMWSRSDTLHSLHAE